MGAKVTLWRPECGRGPGPEYSSTRDLEYSSTRGPRGPGEKGTADASSCIYSFFPLCVLKHETIKKLTALHPVGDQLAPTPIKTNGKLVFWVAQTAPGAQKRYFTPKAHFGPQNALWGQKATFCPKNAFWAPTAPKMSKKPYRKCVFLSPAREVAFWAQKCVLGPKNNFWAPKAPKRQKVAPFAPWRPGGASRPQTLIGVMVFHPSEGAKKRQNPLLAPKCVLGPKSALWAQKRTLGRKSAILRKKRILGPNGPQNEQETIQKMCVSEPGAGSCVLGPKMRFGPQKQLLGAKSSKTPKSRTFRALAPRWRQQAPDPYRSNGFPPFRGGQKATSSLFGPKMRFGAQKRTLGPKTHFGAENALWAQK